MSLRKRLIAWLADDAPAPKVLADPVAAQSAGEILNLGGGLYVLGPTPELLADAEQWNEIIHGYPVVRQTPVRELRWH